VLFRSRKSGVNQAKFFAAENAYECYRRGEIDAKNRKILDAAVPDREEAALVYKLIGKKPVGIQNLYFMVSEKMNYFKFRIILDIFDELGFISTDYFEQTVCKNNSINKTELNNSELLKKIKGDNI
jgi:single-stranded-DNA-specific exonuclease